MEEQMLEVAKKAALEAGKILLEQFKQENSYSLKEDYSNATQADKDAERVIIDIIKASFPDHEFLAEESGKQGNSDYIWIIDPLDGTSNFVRGIPIFGIAIALSFKNSIIMGVSYLPTREELYWAQKDKGAFLNDKQLRISEKDTLKEGIIFFEGGRDESSRKKLGEVMKVMLPKIGTFKKFGSSVYSLPLIAKGDAEAMVEMNSNPWDVASGLIIIKEAGGKCTDFAGEDVDATGNDLIITNGYIHEKVLQALNESSN